MHAAAALTPVWTSNRLDRSLKKRGLAQPTTTCGGGGQGASTRGVVRRSTTHAGVANQRASDGGNGRAEVPPSAGLAPSQRPAHPPSPALGPPTTSNSLSQSSLRSAPLRRLITQFITTCV